MVWEGTIGMDYDFLFSFNRNTFRMLAEDLMR
jgi:hypothetical protein